MHNNLISDSYQLLGKFYQNWWFSFWEKVTHPPHRNHLLLLGWCKNVKLLLPISITLFQWKKSAISFSGTTYEFEIDNRAFLLKMHQRNTNILTAWCLMSVITSKKCFGTQVTMYSVWMLLHDHLEKNKWNQFGI